MSTAAFENTHLDTPSPMPTKMSTTSRNIHLETFIRLCQQKFQDAAGADGAASIEALIQAVADPVLMALTKYPEAEHVSGITGFRCQTRLGKSSIPQAGLGRFTTEPVKEGDIIRSQTAGNPSLDVYRNVDDIKARVKKDSIKFIEDFGHCGPQDRPETTGLLFTNFPPLYSNHGSAATKNIRTTWKGDVKLIVATRDIAVGEELMEDYREFGKVDWYEDFLISQNCTPVRCLGETIG